MVSLTSIIQIKMISRLRHIKVIIFVNIIGGIFFSINAQTGEKTSRELYKDYIANVNRGDLSTNFFLNKGFIDDDEVTSLYQFIEGFNEETSQLVPPTSQMDGFSWMQMYRSLLESRVNKQGKLPSIGEISTRLDNNNSTEINVPLLIFDVKGELLEDLEIENSIDKKVKQTPYNNVHLFGAISYTSEFFKKNIYFDLKEENYFSGFDKKESEIFIDFSDGRGVKKYNSSQGVVPVTYTSLGEKVIKVYRNANLNGVSMRIGSSFVIEIKADINGKPSNILESNIDTTSSAKVLSGRTPIIRNSGGAAHIFKGGVFDKPLIIVQGFDPTGGIDLESQRDKYENFESILLNQGYDLVYIMLNNTNATLQHNTNIVKDLIKKINLQKQKNYESIIIGESMGGLLSRMALKQLENEDYDHSVGLYVSFDAPHQGANFPPGLQHAFKDVIDSRTFRGVSSIIGFIDRAAIFLGNLFISPYTGGRVSSSLKDALEINTAHKALAALNSPAAKSMLVRHISPDGYFKSSQNTLKRLGYPSKTRNIAIINGSNESRDLQLRRDGTFQRMVPGEQIFRLPAWRTDCNEFSINAWSSPVNTNARVSRIKWKAGLKVPDIRIKWENKCLATVFGTCISRTKIPVKTRVGLKCASTNFIDIERRYPFNGASYDNAPGSTLPGLDNLPFDITSNTAFVPTASAIDLSSTAYNSLTDPNGLRAITNRWVLDDFIRNDQTPFDEVYSKAYNAAHVLFQGADFTNFNQIITDEFMSERLFLQKRHINNNRDFSAENEIFIGNNVNTISNKIIKNGDILIDNNAIVNIAAGNKITISEGTTIKEGVTVVFKTTNTSFRAQKRIIEDNFDIVILGKKTFSNGLKPSFKVLVSNPDNNYSYNWSLVDGNATSSNSEFILEDFLLPGLHTVKVEVSSTLTSNKKTLTKVFKVEYDLNTVINTNSAENLVSEKKTIEDSLVIYPNPTIRDATIISNKDIAKVNITDAKGLLLDSILINNNIWGTINLESYTSGIYILKIIYEDGTISSKKIIKK